jgi:hypothetical protein
MYTIVISIIIAIVAGSCIFGKKFWENRLTFLGIAAALMLVSILTANFISRKHLPVKAEVTKGYVLRSFYVENAALKDPSCNWVKSPTFEADDWSPRFQKKVETAKKLVKKNTYEYTYKFANQKSAHYLIYTHEGDTLIGFVKDEDGEPEVGYYSLDQVKLAPMTDKMNKPQIQYVSHKYADGNNWAVAFSIPNYDSYNCIYLPKSEYENLPSNIKSRCYLDKKEVYVASL